MFLHLFEHNINIVLTDSFVQNDGWTKSDNTSEAKYLFVGLKFNLRYEFFYINV